MKFLSKTLAVLAITASLVSTANAGTTYYVYKKGSSSECDISTKGPSQYNRGSKWALVGSDSTRSGAKKAGKNAGCSSF